VIRAPACVAQYPADLTYCANSVGFGPIKIDGRNPRRPVFDRSSIVALLTALTAPQCAINSGSSGVAINRSKTHAATSRNEANENRRHLPLPADPSPAGDSELSRVIDMSDITTNAMQLTQTDDCPLFARSGEKAAIISLPRSLIIIISVAIRICDIGRRRRRRRRRLYTLQFRSNRCIPFADLGLD